LKKYKILFLSSEVKPFAGSGVMAEVSCQLPIALKELGHEVRLIMPQYKTINERKYILRDVIRLKEIVIPVGDEVKKINVRSAFIPNSKVQIYFIDFKPYFGREGLRESGVGGKNNKNNSARFILFNRGILETLKQLHWQPDIIHCNDWQTGLIPLYLKALFKNDPFFQKISIIFTIHNPSILGIFPKDIVKKSGISESEVHSSAYIKNNKNVSLLKTGLYYSDFISVTSDNFLHNMHSSKPPNCELNSLFKLKKESIVSILNGVNYAYWSPDIDKHLVKNYNIRSIAGKIENKKALLKRFNLPFETNTPLIGFIYYKDNTKIQKILKDALCKSEKLKFQMVIIDSSEKFMNKDISMLQKKYPNKFGVSTSYSEKLLHQFIAGCDMIFDISDNESESINPAILLKYGTVPIIYSNGKVSDGVSKFSSATNSGTGFIFYTLNSQDVLKTINQSLKHCKDVSHWHSIMRNGMKENFSWQVVAKKYLKLYTNAIKSS